MVDVKKVADEANVIVNGYAFTKCELGFRVLNLNNSESAAVFSKQGKLLETTMDDIEIIKENYRDMYLKWRQYSKNSFYEDNP